MKQSHSEETKKKALDLIASGASAKKVSRDLNINYTTLINWKSKSKARKAPTAKYFKSAPQKSFPGVNVDEALKHSLQMNIRLEDENKRLRKVVGCLLGDSCDGV